MNIKTFLRLLPLVLLIACSEAPRQVIFDTDWWTDVDDACALRLLLQQEREGKVNLRGVCLSAVCGSSVALHAGRNLTATLLAVYCWLQLGDIQMARIPVIILPDIKVVIASVILAAAGVYWLIRKRYIP